MHEPTGDFLKIYRAMETAYKEGKARAIGVSNFLESNFKTLIENVEVISAVNQVETHVFRQKEELRKLEKKVGTIHESWSPLTCGRNNIFSNEILKRIAAKYEKTPAQVVLRFLTQQDIITISKTTHQERMIENLESLDFNLENDDIRSLKELDIGKSLFNWW